MSEHVLAIRFLFHTSFSHWCVPKLRPQVHNTDRSAKLWLRSDGGQRALVGSRRRSLHQGPVRRRSQMGSQDPQTCRIAAQNTPRPDACHFGYAHQKGRHTWEALLPSSHLQDQRETWCLVHHWTQYQLCGRHAVAFGQAWEPLDRKRFTFKKKIFYEKLFFQNFFFQNFLENFDFEFISNEILKQN